MADHTNTKNHFCTLFNQHYLSRGLALVKSLEENCQTNFKIHILAMDEITARILKNINNPKINVIKLDDFETEDLLRVKKERSVGEYCWTCTPAIVKHCLEKYNLKECTYVDADLYFFHDPEILLNEVRNSNKSVLITPHNYTRKFDQSEISGIYCVQFMYFRNDTEGKVVLNDWYSKCIDWCFNRAEDGKFGDQKYLDEWPKNFNNSVHILKHLGTAAPWNIQQYSLEDKNNKPYLVTNSGVFELVFYHFHSLQVLNNLKTFNGYYPISRSIRNRVYSHYTKELLTIDSYLMKEYCLNEVIEFRKKIELNFFSKAKLEITLTFWRLLYFILK